MVDRLDRLARCLAVPLVAGEGEARHAQFFAHRRPGQEITKTPSAEYIEAAKRAREHIARLSAAA